MSSELSLLDTVPAEEFSSLSGRFNKLSERHGHAVLAIFSGATAMAGAVYYAASNVKSSETYESAVLLSVAFLFYASGHLGRKALGKSEIVEKEVRALEAPYLIAPVLASDDRENQKAFSARL